MLRAILYEDDHLLIVNKPAGINTHAPAPFAGEGIYDWPKHREPRWANLAIIHRLDKETSGVIVFGKTPTANRSLTDQFTRRAVSKRYLFLTDRVPSSQRFSVRSHMTRVGERYRSGKTGEFAETHFQVVRDGTGTKGFTTVQAEPLTGRTHQIRVHAADSGIPILGDVSYGGSPYQRVCLHASELAFEHPPDQRKVRFSAPADFGAHPSAALRDALIDPIETNAFREIHGASDGLPGLYVDRLGDYFLSQSEHSLSQEQRGFLERWIRDRNLTPESKALHSEHEQNSGCCLYHRTLSKHVRGKLAESSPVRISGPRAATRFLVLENGVKFELSFEEGYSTGLFLDQRDNRRRWLCGHIAAGFPMRCATAEEGDFRVLNVFAYTCAFSVCAAKAGAVVTSLDLSRKYLDWGRSNFTLNHLDPEQHDFIFGDAFDWLRRFRKKGREFEAVILDPPTFSQSKESGVFRAERDFERLISAALPLLSPNGILFASTNAATLRPEHFVQSISNEISKAGRKIEQQYYAPQPPDFPVSRAEPAYLKTLWVRVR